MAPGLGMQGPAGVARKTDGSETQTLRPGWFDMGLRKTTGRPLRQAQDRLSTNGRGSFGRLMAGSPRYFEPVHHERDPA